VKRPKCLNALSKSNEHHSSLTGSIGAMHEIYFFWRRDVLLLKGCGCYGGILCGMVLYNKQRIMVAANWRVTGYDWFYANKLRRTKKRLAFCGRNALLFSQD